MQLSNEPDIDSLIYHYAETKQDLPGLLQRLFRQELFCAVVKGLPNLAPGTRHVTQPEDQIHIRLADMNGLRLVLFYTAKSDKRHGGSVVSMSGREAFEMTLKTNTDGLLVQNAKTSWFGLTREGIIDALKQG